MNDILGKNAHKTQTWGYISSKILAFLSIKKTILFIKATAQSHDFIIPSFVYELKFCIRDDSLRL